MKNSSGKGGFSQGFTLIELLVVVAMVALLLSLAAPGFNTMRLNQKLASASNELYGSVLQARNEALNLNRRVTVAPMTGTDWKTGWRIYVDLDSDDAYSTTDRLILETGPVDASFTLTGDGGGATPDNFSFDSRGFLRGGAGSRIIFKSAQTGREKQVIVFVTGRARLCDPKLNTNCTGT